MFEAILGAVKSDAELGALLRDAREYAEIYQMAGKRQKGCDGMGELAMVREDFRDAVEKVIQYYQERNHVSRDISYDIDAVADMIAGAPP